MYQLKVRRLCQLETIIFECTADNTCSKQLYAAEAIAMQAVKNIDQKGARAQSSGQISDGEALYYACK